jgi:hypothetical protein
VQGGLVRQDRPLQGLQLRPRAQSELLVQHASRLAVGLERLALAAGAVEGEHQLATEALPERVPRHQHLELRHQPAVAPELEVRLDAVLDRRRAQLLQPGDLGLRERLEREVGERRATPLLQRGAEPRGGALGLPRLERPAALLPERLEAVEVELARFEREAVARGRGLQPAAASSQRPPQSRDRHLQRLDRVPPRLPGPQVVREPVGEHRLAATEQQQRQDGPGTGAAELQSASVDPRLDRAEDAEVHPASIPEPRPDGNRTASFAERRRSGEGRFR